MVWGSDTGAVEVAVCSTGLIGDRLPMDKVLAGVTAIVHEMAGGLTGGEEAARAIMTTDTVPKQVALHHSDNWTVGGMAKGAGMLAPSLATMLTVITTDAVAGGYDPLTAATTGGVRTQFANNTIPVNRINPVAQRVMDLYPLPNLPGINNNRLDVLNRDLTDNGGNVRIDQHFSDKDSFFVRYSYEAFDLFDAKGQSGCCYQTPASAYGEDLIMEIPGVYRDPMPHENNIEH